MIRYVVNHPGRTRVRARPVRRRDRHHVAELPFGGDGPTFAALRGGSLLAPRPTNPTARAM